MLQRSLEPQRQQFQRSTDNHGPNSGNHRASSFPHPTWYMSLTMGEFYGEEIEVRFDGEPPIEKKSVHPSAFTWHGREHIIVELLEEWHDCRPLVKSQIAPKYH